MQWKLFATLAEATGSKTVSVDVDGDATVADALDALIAAHPGLADQVLDEEGTLHDHINVLRNGENVFATADGLETDVDDEDELAMFPPVSGGARDTAA